MKNGRTVPGLLGRRFLVFMTLLLVVDSARPAAAADARMQVTGKTLLEITGGAGPRPWRIRYGTTDSYQKQLVMAGENRAWFSHGSWLRLIDTEKGVVIGRWHFPEAIVRLAPIDGEVQLEIADKSEDHPFRRGVIFNPQTGSGVPYWPNGNIVLYRLSISEVELVWQQPGPAGILSEKWEAPGEQEVKQHITELEEAIRRDSASPWFRVALWRLLQREGDPRAPAVLEEALQVKTTDFSEILPMAGLLEQLDERESARAAFELGYRDFLDRGNDPRLMMTLIGKMILYRPWVSKLPDLNSEHGRELMERTYRLAPHCEAADLAWQMYAAILVKNGRTEEARKWRTRAEEAASTSVFLIPRSSTLLSDWMILLVMAAMISAGLLIVLMWIRYRPQRRADVEAGENRGWVRRAFASLSFQHWSRSQRIAFLSIVVVAWVATGFVVGIVQGILRAAETPISSGMGSLAGPATIWFFENKLPATLERNLLLAVAYQQSGDINKAERLYRGVPVFAESWNNLGVILKSAGKDQEARQAFEKALQLDPGLAEAALNLGRAPQGIWAEQYAKYFPGRPMLAPPRGERFSTAFFGGSMRKVFLRGLAGPFAEAHPWRLFTLVGPLGSEDAPAAHIATGIYVAALALAVALFFIPYHPVTQPASKTSRVLEVLFLGASPAWGPLGGLVLVAWISLLLQGLLIYKIGSPFILTSIAVPSPSRAYGLPPADAASVFQIVNPGWVWVYLAPVVLFVVNLVLVLASRWKMARAS